jgi:hypothetical protein
MKANLLTIALLLLATVSFSQAKQESKTDEKPLRKIASGNGAQRINEEVEREVAAAMKEVRVQLDGLDIKVNVDVARQLEGLDEEIERSLEGLDDIIEQSLEASLEGLDVDIEQSLEQSLKALENLNINVNFDNGHFDHDRSIEEFRKEALRDDLKNDQPKKTPKKKDE